MRVVKDDIGHSGVGFPLRTLRIAAELARRSIRLWRKLWLMDGWRQRVAFAAAHVATPASWQRRVRPFGR